MAKLSVFKYNFGVNVRGERTKSAPGCKLCNYIHKAYELTRLMPLPFKTLGQASYFAYSQTTFLTIIFYNNKLHFLFCKIIFL